MHFWKIACSLFKDRPGPTSFSFPPEKIASSAPSSHHSQQLLYLTARFRMNQLFVSDNRSPELRLSSQLSSLLFGPSYNSKEPRGAGTTFRTGTLVFPFRSRIGSLLSLPLLSQIVLLSSKSRAVRDGVQGYRNQHFLEHLLAASPTGTSFFLPLIPKLSMLFSPV